MPDIFAPTIETEIVKNNFSTEQFQRWMSDITIAVNNITPILGVGPPEGVEVASPGSFYIDTNLSNVFLKSTGDGDTGWIQT